jgi:hypothetical protein
MTSPVAPEKASKRATLPPEAVGRPFRSRPWAVPTIFPAAQAPVESGGVELRRKPQ